MFEYSDFTVKNYRIVQEEFEERISEDEFRGASDVFTGLCRMILERNNIIFVAEEISKVLKRLQEDLAVYQDSNTTINHSPGVSMDGVMSVLLAYSKVCKNHKITISKEKLLIDVTIKARDFYPEMKAKYATDNLLLSEEILATVIIKIFDPRFKTSNDFEEIITRSKELGLDCFSVLKRVYLATFGNNIAETNKLNKMIDIKVNSFMKDKEYDFLIKDGSIKFITSVNDFLPVIMYFLDKTPNLLTLLSCLKEQIIESLEKNLRLFTDEIHKTQVILGKIELDRKRELDKIKNP